MPSWVLRRRLYIVYSHVMFALCDIWYQLQKSRMEARIGSSAMSVSAVAIRARAIGAASKAGLLAMAQSSESWPGKDGFSFPQMLEPRDEGIGVWACFGASGC